MRTSGGTINLILNADAADMTNPLMDVPEKAPGYTHMALVVDDVDAMMQYLTTNGIAITEGPVEFPRWQHSSTVRSRVGCG